MGGIPSASGKYTHYNNRNGCYNNRMDTIIIEMDAIIVEMDAIIIEMDAIIIEMDAIIIEMDAIIIEMDAIIMIITGAHERCKATQRSIKLPSYLYSNHCRNMVKDYSI